MPWSGVSSNLLWQLALRDFRRRFVGSLLGWLWVVIHPLVLLVVYTFLFQYAFRARLPPEEATENYPLFLLAGLLPWLLFSETVTRSAASVPEYAALVKRSVFPSEAVPVSILVSTLVAHLTSLGVLLVGAALWGHWPSLALAALPLVAVPLAILAVGLGWAVAALHVYLRDTAHVLAIVLTAWFWATPIFLPEAFYRGRLDFVLDWNPLRYAVAGYRGALLGSGVGLWDSAVLWAAGLAAAAAGWLVFRRLKRGFAEVL